MGFVITEDNVELVQKAASEAVYKVLEALGLQAEGYAQMAAPVDTGRLRNSITHQVSEEANEVYIGTNVEYAVFQEEGTKHIKPKHFLQNAVSNHNDEYNAIIKDILENTDI